MHVHGDLITDICPARYCANYELSFSQGIGFQRQCFN